MKEKKLESLRKVLDDLLPLKSEMISEKKYQTVLKEFKGVADEYCAKVIEAFIKDNAPSLKVINNLVRELMIVRAKEIKGDPNIFLRQPKVDTFITHLLAAEAKANGYKITDANGDFLTPDEVKMPEAIIKHFDYIVAPDTNDRFNFKGLNFSEFSKITLSTFNVHKTMILREAEIQIQSVEKEIKVLTKQRDSLEKKEANNPDTTVLDKEIENLEAKKLKLTLKSVVAVNSSVNIAEAKPQIISEVLDKTSSSLSSLASKESQIQAQINNSNDSNYTLEKLFPGVSDQFANNDANKFEEEITRKLNIFQKAWNTIKNNPKNTAAVAALGTIGIAATIVTGGGALVGAAVGAAIGWGGTEAYYSIKDKLVSKANNPKDIVVSNPTNFRDMPKDVPTQTTNITTSSKQQAQAQENNVQTQDKRNSRSGTLPRNGAEGREDQPVLGPKTAALKGSTGIGGRGSSL